MNADKAAYPSPDALDPDAQPGVTKRELAAMLALQGLLANPYFASKTTNFASFALVCADALLAALENKETK